MKDRIYWIDYLKAFAIFLVVLGHLGLENDAFLKTWIYGFHMPLFVFASGLFAHKQHSFLTAFRKDVKRLCIPYLFFSLFLIPFYVGVGFLSGIQNSYTLIVVGEKLLMDDYYHCGPIWFLGALLIIRTLYNSFYHIKLGVILTIIGFCLLYDIHILSIDSAIALFPYYVAGSFCPQLLKTLATKKVLLLAIFGLVVYSAISIFNGTIDYDQMKLGSNTLLTYTMGLIGYYSITFLFSYFNQYHNSLLVDIGMNTLTILGLHSIFIQVFRYIYKILSSNCLPFWYLFFISILTIIICYWISILLMKYCPVVIGRNSNKKREICPSCFR